MIGILCSPLAEVVLKHIFYIQVQSYSFVQPLRTRLRDRCEFNLL